MEVRDNRCTAPQREIRTRLGHIAGRMETVQRGTSKYVPFLASRSGRFPRNRAAGDRSANKGLGSRARRRVPKTPYVSGTVAPCRAASFPPSLRQARQPVVECQRWGTDARRVRSVWRWSGQCRPAPYGLPPRSDVPVVRRPRDVECGTDVVQREADVGLELLGE
jgi:hypothetical protein